MQVCKYNEMVYVKYFILSQSNFSGIMLTNTVFSGIMIISYMCLLLCVISEAEDKVKNRWRIQTIIPRKS